MCASVCEKFNPPYSTRVLLITDIRSRNRELSPALDVLQFTKQARFIGGLHYVGRLMHGICELFEIGINPVEAPGVL